VNQTFPGGIKIDSLRETVFDDQCHMTNFRLALVFHYQ
jgi:hypothetical protein